MLCLSVSPHDISKSDAARITKLDKENCLKISPGNSFILGVKGQGHESPRNIASVGICTLVSAAFF